MNGALTRGKRRELRRRIHIMHWIRVVLIALLLPMALLTGVVLFVGGAGLLGPELAAPEALEAMADPAADGTMEDGDWCLTLVNSWNALPSDFAVELTQLGSGPYVDGRICPALEEMFRSARQDGVYPAVQVGYRTGQQQKRAQEERIDAYRALGYTTAEAVAAAEREEAAPGSSEHQLGIAVDIGGDGVNSADRDVQRWLRDNSWRYGFILRYPEDKTAVTGMEYAPEHYRYVGAEAAAAMYEQGLCLEEYLLTMK